MGILAGNKKYEMETLSRNEKLNENQIMKYCIFPLFALILFNILFLTACTKGERQLPESGLREGRVERPSETWVFRSVLDKKPRMISMGLHHNLWVAYNTKTAGLYKSWAGGIDFDGAVYTKAHGPQPTSLGTSYQEEPDQNPWRIVTEGRQETPEVRYRGHAFRDQQVVLKYDLLYQGQVIQVEETPEYIDVQGDPGKVGLERTFALSGVPAGSLVALTVHLSAITSEGDLTSTGTFRTREQSAGFGEQQHFRNLIGDLVLNSHGSTILTVIYTLIPGEQGPEVLLEGEEAVLAMMARSDCSTCHNMKVQTVGPSYLAIAKRYPNNIDSRNWLTSRVINGGVGNWGEVPMTPHPDMRRQDAMEMVSYILELDAEEEKERDKTLLTTPVFPISFIPVEPATLDPAREYAGLAVNLYQFDKRLASMPQMREEMVPQISGVMNALHAVKENDFCGLQFNFVMQAAGFINVLESTNTVFRLVSNKGASLYIGDRLVIDDNPSDGTQPKDGEMYLKPGKYPILVKYFQNTGDKRLSLQWHQHGAEGFTVVPPEVFTHSGTMIKATQEAPLALRMTPGGPGNTNPLVEVHPSFDMAQARPEAFKPKVGGMDFLSDGRLVVSTWDSLGSVYMLEGVQENSPEAIKVTRIATGLAEPLGLKVVDDEIYVLQKQELTKLVDVNGDGIIDAYETICNGWEASANFHEFAFGLVYRDGYFYGALATAINPGGASTQPQIPDRGKVLKISKQDGSFSFVASGLRTPNGIGIGTDNELFIADNQGDWLPASKIVHLQEGAWYGSRSVDFVGTAHLKESLPVVWLPQNEIGNSPSQPIRIDVGPYQNQMLHGDVTHGGIKRVFVEKVEGQYQGAVFRFTQGLEAGINRLVWGPDGALYAGGVGSSGNWSHAGKSLYGLQRLTFNQQTAFEMLAVRARPQGLEIEFTEQLKEGVGTSPEDYLVKQWWYQPTKNYGGPKRDENELAVQKITLSPDRRKVFLEISGMKPKHVVYIRLNQQSLSSQSGQQLWATEAWYTLNVLPKDTRSVERR